MSYISSASTGNQMLLRFFEPTVIFKLHCCLHNEVVGLCLYWLRNYWGLVHWTYKRKHGLSVATGSASSRKPSGPAVARDIILATPTTPKPYLSSQTHLDELQVLIWVLVDHQLISVTSYTAGSDIYTQMRSSAHLGALWSPAYPCFLKPTQMSSK